MDDTINKVNHKFEMEQKKSSRLILENKELKNDKNDLVIQVDELANILEEKDGMLIELGEKCKNFEREINLSQLQLKQRKLSTANNMLGNNPLARHNAK